MARLKAPTVVRDVLADRGQRGVLFTATLALLAVGLLPRILSPSLPTAQEQLRLQPELQNLYLLVAFAATALVLLGGLVSDIVRRRELLIGGLGTMVVGALVCVVIPEGGIFYAANLAAVAAAGVVLAYAIGAVATAYAGIPRATALGVVFAAYGVGAALSPIVLTLLPRRIPSVDAAAPSSFTFDTWVIYVLAAVVAGAALLAALRWSTVLSGTRPASRRLIVSVAAWSLSILAIVTGVLGLGGQSDGLIPVTLIVGGAVGLGVLMFGARTTAREMAALRLDRRGLGAALAVGMAIGFAQAIPLMVLPIVFEYPLRYGATFAVVAVAPFFIALILAGPISGLLIRRFGPRGVLSGGTLGLGIANILLAIAIGWISGEIQSAFEADPTGAGQGLDRLHYLTFIVPLLLVGAGFILATTVRTAIVFAGTPRGLAATAAAVNEASVALGSRIGVVAGTSAVLFASLSAARELLADVTKDMAGPLAEQFEVGLVSIGTPRFEEVLRVVLEEGEPLKRSAYSVAYLEGVAIALVLSGLVGVGGAVLAWFLTGRRNPIRTVYDMEDERPAT